MLGYTSDPFRGTICEHGGCTSPRTCMSDLGNFGCTARCIRHCFIVVSVHARMSKVSKTSVSKKPDLSRLELTLSFREDVLGE